ncbi:hypothetical protein [Salmonirosea aquatica]|uniref:Uncharacterized protein n=1 Tax=Salmonirosea aquatica TaxID=2654236 RepID=A0A7C9BNV4_9BACT|nr:hypothetical protein [Cytophagaceae bacterium SJW1-29]MPR37135.1 hypothetical protein [Cytophagaceae bacterium SJW1-29]
MKIDIPKIIDEYLRQRSLLIEKVTAKPNPYNREIVVLTSRIDTVVAELIDLAEGIETVPSEDES